VLQRLEGLVGVFRPERLVVLGDLFHSVHNHRWAPFATWVKQLGIPVELVPGNHDILAHRHYREAGLTLHDDTVEAGPFVFTHEPVERPGCYVIAGHVHPGVRLSGLGGQSMRLPCFRFGPQQALLPAFGMATGLHLQRPTVEDRTYAVTERAVLDVSGLLKPQGRAQR
ncbi:MAG: metallophosphoesterase, partial [Flavobacteriales bacterium]|nr:metallophosphoesterase [Flavobacteriales bacterium]